MLIEWVYEIDLDHEVFHVDSNPIFNLRNMPDEDLFIQGISFDKYGHRAHHESLPEEYRYNWKAAPLAPCSTSLEVYDLHCAPIALLEVDQLLELPSSLTPREHSRAHFFNAFVGTAMRTFTLGHELRRLEIAQEVADMPESLTGLGRDLVAFAFGPMVFMNVPVEPPKISSTWEGDLRASYLAHFKLPPIGQISLPKPQEGKDTSGDMTWLHKSVCFHIALHLDAEPNLKAAIGELVQFVKQDTVKPDLDRGPVVYGVVTSLFHCALVKIDISRDYTFHHTPALQLLPSFNATSPSTTGLTALIRLGCSLPCPDMLAQLIERCAPLQSLAQSLAGLSGRTRLDGMPTEMIAHIGTYLTDPMDLAHFALTGRHVKASISSTSSDPLRWPHVEGARLAVPIEPLDLHYADLELWTSTFRAEDSKGSLVVQVGAEPSYSVGEFDKKSFESTLGLVEFTLRCSLGKR
ncbi:hypothetical protein HGRIS_002802 [Hohenbuehelia grisea]|uniref:Uncharacterized protein n=1 Tax=Hohenbuehelia grisea TaxID=104357 RepID=A0ABR3JLQ8_9AGAR